ncbi:MAG: membrane protein insertion efficiency factor YidD [Candidatus Peribacteraceae bacterium]|nr:membrane protein insertion efficiency factor YidD [Candidatus Peribacteraceae bacterium]
MKLDYNFPNTARRILATPFIVLVRVYQATLSPDHSWLAGAFPYGFCRHQPTCSQYAVEKLQKESLPKALWLIFKRVVSCNPWTKVSEEKMRKVIAKNS